MIYSCLLGKHIWEDQEKSIEGTIHFKFIDLEFVPFEGLLLESGDTYASMGRINLVSYGLDATSMRQDKGFYLEVQDEAPFYSSLHQKILSHDDLLKIYKENGWQEYLDLYSENKTD